MNDALYMIELNFNLEKLIRFARNNGIMDKRDEDFGYCAHAWLSSAFGKLAPKPFRFFNTSRRGRRMGSGARMYIYTTNSPKGLKKHARTYAAPSTISAVDINDLDNAKKMPEKWEKGQRVGFEALVLPVTRKDNKEKDIFLRRLEAENDDDNPVTREKAYIQWLEKQLLGAAKLGNSRLESYRLTNILRRSRANGSKKSNLLSVRRPQALIKGELRVLEGERFSKLLARGVGRHRAFGYGMFLLKPV